MSLSGYKTGKDCHSASTTQVYKIGTGVWGHWHKTEQECHLHTCTQPDGNAVALTQNKTGMSGQWRFYKTGQKENPHKTNRKTTSTKQNRNVMAQHWHTNETGMKTNQPPTPTEKQPPQTTSTTQYNGTKWGKTQVTGTKEDRKTTGTKLYNGAKRGKTLGQWCKRVQECHRYKRGQEPQDTQNANSQGITGMPLAQNRTGMPLAQSRTRIRHKKGQVYHGHKTAGNEECQNTGIKIKWGKNAKLKAQNRTGMPLAQNRTGIRHKTGQVYHEHKTTGNEECQNTGIKIKWDKNAKLKA